MNLISLPLACDQGVPWCCVVAHNTSLHFRRANKYWCIDIYCGTQFSKLFFSSATMPDAHGHFCRGVTNGVSCDCEEFLAPQNHQVGTKLVCMECLHGPSRHPVPSRVAPKPADSSRVLSGSFPASVTAVSSVSQSDQPSRDSVMSIFKQTVSVPIASASSRYSILAALAPNFDFE